MKGFLSCLCCLVMVAAPPGLFAQSAGALVFSQNLTSDAVVSPYSSANPYSPKTFLSVGYVGDSLTPQHELVIQGVALIENTSSKTGTIDVLLVNASPLCGFPYGVAPYGPGRVQTVSIGPGEIVAVPIMVIDWVNTGSGSWAQLQYRHASPGLKVKENSYVDVLMIPAPNRKEAIVNSQVSNTPNEGPPFQPNNCP